MRYSPRNIEIAFSHAGLTHYGGILFLSEFSRMLQLRRVLTRHLLFWLPGELTRPQNRPTLRFANSALIQKWVDGILHRVHRLPCSAKTVGRFRLRKPAQGVIKGDFHGIVGAKTVRTSGHHTKFVVEALDGAVGYLAFGTKPVQQQLLMGA